MELENNEAVEQTEEERQAEYDKAFFGEDDVETKKVDSVDEPVVTEDVDAVDEEIVEEELGDDIDVATKDDKEEPAKTFKLKRKGQEVEVTEDELLTLAGQGLDFTYKAQQLSSHRKLIEFANVNHLSLQDMELLSKIKGGDAEAIAHIAKAHNIDLYKASEIENPNVALHNEALNIVPSRQVVEVIEAVELDTNLHNRLAEIENELPASFRKVISQDANVLTGLITEVQSGQYDIVKPYVDTKLATMNEFDRAMVMNNPQAFIALYSTEKEALLNLHKQDDEPTSIPEVKQARPVQKKKPNMAEVGVTSRANVHRDNSLDDAQAIWDDDSKFAAIKAKMGL